MVVVVPGPERLEAAIAPPLYEGDTLSCPECGRCMPLWEWNRPGRELSRPAPHRGRLLPSYRCPACRFIFAPIPRGYRLVPE
jgi:ssDNA-binding Zn-finger/Zn-ribbon topoisomerase 1